MNFRRWIPAKFRVLEATMRAFLYSPSISIAVFMCSVLFWYPHMGETDSRTARQPTTEKKGDGSAHRWPIRLSECWKRLATPLWCKKDQKGGLMLHWHSTTQNYSVLLSILSAEFCKFHGFFHGHHGGWHEEIMFHQINSNCWDFRSFWRIWLMQLSLQVATILLESHGLFDVT